MTRITMIVRGTLTVTFDSKAGKMWAGIPDAYTLQEWAQRHDFTITRLELVEEGEQ